MARKTSTPEPPTRRIELLISRQAAKAQIEERVQMGQALLAQLQRPNALEAIPESEKWTSYNARMLGTLFSTNEIERTYAWCSPPTVISPWGDPPEWQRLRGAQERLVKQLQNLESVVEQLPLYPEPVSGEPAASAAASIAAQDPLAADAAIPSKVFVVHGRSMGWSETVARFLEQLRIEPVILHEQANRGDTLIEKLERHSDVPFAVVLLTPDDEGRLAALGEVLRPRARQNVVLELGYFAARLGRERVCALHGGEIEVPSDWHGVTWVALDDRGAWKMELFRELKAAGFDVDMNLVL
jgi:predicted nucleotide-binding protein